MASKTVNNAAKIKEDAREDLIAKQNERLVQVLQSLEAEVLAIGSQLKTSGGLITNDAVNLKIATDARAELLAVFEKDFTNDFVIPSIREYDEIAVEIKQYMERVGITANFTALDTEVIRALKEGSFAQFNILSREFQATLANEMYLSVVGNREFSEMVKSLQGSLRSLEDVRGVPMSVHAETLAHDALITFDRSLSTQKAQDAGIDNYLYFGSVVKDSRSICAREAGRTRTLRDWEELWASEDWSGKKSSNFLTDAGGWNCGHVPVPVPLEE